MNNVIKTPVAYLLLIAILLFSCKKLDDLNVNPNGVDETAVNPNLILPTILSETGKLYTNLGYQDIAGVVQHTQKDAWFESHNDYDWAGSQSWTDYYNILRNTQLLMNRAEESGQAFHQGVGLVMKAYVFGLIADLWGDAPYTDALKGNLNDPQYLTPKYDTQADIYHGILAELETANNLLSQPASSYTGIEAAADLFYNGDPAAWRRFANSLALRYYMRLSAKEASFAQAGIEKIATNPDQYPLILAADEDAAMSYPGTTSANAWPSNTEIDDTGGSNFRRLKMCATLVNTLQQLDDPRLTIWAQKVEIPLVVDATLPPRTDRISNGKRYLSPDMVANTSVDTDPDYVGIPPSYSNLPSSYNLNPTPGQTSFNPHVSYLNERYRKASGPLLKARLLSAAEVHFILAEASLKGWNTGNAAEHYNAAIEASLDAWQLAANYNAYIETEGVRFDGSLEQLITQKWIASWTAATEAWFDYRRTGYPRLQAGPVALRRALPLRFYYMQDEINMNGQHVQEALDRLSTTAFSQADGKNSAWSKCWLLQDTNNPY
ncbi:MULTISPECIES: SusD/RagB family nutrient-binding outer membrane lipoprotein [Olivibacter]|uniref:SusD/RagB family nutrient-binding outer membrane lipoprotein n=1 Tax=Olivibacter jilunii TaxID=985016 RepID=A0ABW6BAM4_9SPHI|nr:SusD/RagB family nutrient-binding outer membrane lipoprotein [Olivibacter sp. UJ_SKK_5.1]MDX3912774.1 SusD/RagB family nutrient-binding outer membrane lipoprotein [Pseudosphingobacterium sp.]